MAQKPEHILEAYWGYPSFRPQQKEIIETTLMGQDLLALLPTGGGKSICYQVPALMGSGLTLVISPLIALMEDQVAALKKRDIAALAINSSLSYRALDQALENAVHGRYKLLYLSPERLQNDLFLERAKRMQIDRIAVDEAHCISQWGYDFRPAYLEIARFREAFPAVPVLALTATATPEVVIDIQRQLQFKKEKVIQQSFRRANLIYSVIKTDNKWQKIKAALRKLPGTAIIYMRNRKGCVEIANWLKSLGFAAEHYHAGVAHEERSAKLDQWLAGKLRIMVCTNAFGMGIDKPDVRLVMHMDLPESLEAYFQEAGRAGRDGKLAHSLVLEGPNDRALLEQKFLGEFPDLALLKRTYQALANHLQLAEGSGQGQSFVIELASLLKQYDLPAHPTYQALRQLSREGWIDLQEADRGRSQLKIRASRRDLYDYQLRYPESDKLIKALVRSYGGLDVEFAHIDEYLLAKRLKWPVEAVKKGLRKLSEEGLVIYRPVGQGMRILFPLPRVKVSELQIDQEQLNARKAAAEKRIKAVEHYLSNHSICRSQQLLAYFGEMSSRPCGACDVCRQGEKADPSELKDLEIRIITMLKEKAISWSELYEKFGDEPALGILLKHFFDQEILFEQDHLIHCNPKKIDHA